MNLWILKLFTFPFWSLKILADHWHLQYTKSNFVSLKLQLFFYEARHTAHHRKVSSIRRLHISISRKFEMEIFPVLFGDIENIEDTKPLLNMKLPFRGNIDLILCKMSIYFQQLPSKANDYKYFLITFLTCILIGFVTIWSIAPQVMEYALHGKQF